jgi:hypothetical protein
MAEAAYGGQALLASVDSVGRPSSPGAVQEIKGSESFSGLNRNKGVRVIFRIK